MTLIQVFYSKISYQNFLTLTNFILHISAHSFRRSTVPSVEASWEQSSVSCSKLYKEILATVLTADSTVW